MAPQIGIICPIWIGAVSPPATHTGDSWASLSHASFDETKERSDKILGHAPTAADGIVYECSGLMFWFTQKKFVGSYLVFKATRRS
jgi:hypothetical protein